jgi:hypothetical protein
MTYHDDGIPRPRGRPRKATLIPAGDQPKRAKRGSVKAAKALDTRAPWEKRRDTKLAKARAVLLKAEVPEADWPKYEEQGAWYLEALFERELTAIKMRDPDYKRRFDLDTAKVMERIGRHKASFKAASDPDCAQCCIGHPTKLPKAERNRTITIPHNPDSLDNFLEGRTFWNGEYLIPPDGLGAFGLYPCHRDHYEHQARLDADLEAFEQQERE